MSLRSTRGTSLIEVMVMMVILSISILGIYSMIKRWQELAQLSNARLSAINIAREWLESVTTLRDTFWLNGYEPGVCEWWASAVKAFFSTDGHILLDDNCPIVSQIISYILGDDKTLRKKTSIPLSNFDVCMNEFWWYSQEFSHLWGNALTDCRVVSPPWACMPCATAVSLCETNTTSSCKTPYKRKITFKECSFVNSLYCINITSKVWWWDSEIDPATSLELSQIITTLK